MPKKFVPKWLKFKPYKPKPKPSTYEIMLKNTKKYFKKNRGPRTKRRSRLFDANFYDPSLKESQKQFRIAQRERFKKDEDDFLVRIKNALGKEGVERMEMEGWNAFNEEQAEMMEGMDPEEESFFEEHPYGEELD